MTYVSNEAEIDENTISPVYTRYRQSEKATTEEVAAFSNECNR